MNGAMQLVAFLVSRAAGFLKRHRVWGPTTRAKALLAASILLAPACGSGLGATTDQPDAFVAWLLGEVGAAAVDRMPEVDTMANFLGFESLAARPAWDAAIEEMTDLIRPYLLPSLAPGLATVPVREALVYLVLLEGMAKEEGKRPAVVVDPEQSLSEGSVRVLVSYWGPGPENANAFELTLRRLSGSWMISRVPRLLHESWFLTQIVEAMTRALDVLPDGFQDIHGPWNGLPPRPWRFEVRQSRAVGEDWFLELEFVPSDGRALVFPAYLRFDGWEFPEPPRPVSGQD